MNCQGINNSIVLLLEAYVNSLLLWGVQQTTSARSFYYTLCDTQISWSSTQVNECLNTELTTLPYSVQICVAILFSPTLNRALANVLYEGLGSECSHNVNIFLFWVRKPGSDFSMQSRACSSRFSWRPTSYQSDIFRVTRSLSFGSGGSSENIHVLCLCVWKSERERLSKYSGDVPWAEPGLLYHTSLHACITHACNKEIWKRITCTYFNMYPLLKPCLRNWLEVWEPSKCANDVTLCAPLKSRAGSLPPDPWIVQ